MKSQQSVGTGAPDDCDARDLVGRQRVEILIDQIMEQSFPASDPPAWGIVSSRFDQAVWSSQTDQEYYSVHRT